MKKPEAEVIELRRAAGCALLLFQLCDELVKLVIAFVRKPESLEEVLGAGRGVTFGPLENSRVNQIVLHYRCYTSFWVS